MGRGRRRAGEGEGKVGKGRARHAPGREPFADRRGRLSPHLIDSAVEPVQAERSGRAGVGWVGVGARAAAPLPTRARSLAPPSAQHFLEVKTSTGPGARSVD
jgi:hypothetical protein